jgi:hypothetical protein
LRWLLKGGLAGAAALAASSLWDPLSRLWPSQDTVVRIVPREEWGADPPNHDAPGEHGFFDPQQNAEGWMVYRPPLAEALTTLIVHHSALPLTDGPREIQVKHMVQRGFADIAYHYLIDAEGVLYEGRPLMARGAHTGGHNTGSVGVVLLGNFQEVEPRAAQLDTLRVIAAALRDAYALTHLAGHRDFQPGVTVCPGDRLAVRLPALAAEQALTFGTGGYVPQSWQVTE